MIQTFIEVYFGVGVAVVAAGFYFASDRELREVMRAAPTLSRHPAAAAAGLALVGLVAWPLFVTRACFNDRTE